MLIDSVTDSGGAARAPKFNAWITSKQKEQAEIYKQRRLYSEESHKVQHEQPLPNIEGGGAPSDPRAPRPERKPKPKPKRPKNGDA